MGLTPGEVAAKAGRQAARAAVDVDAVARLAQLSVPAEGRAEMAAQLEEMVAFAQQLSSVDTSAEAAMEHVGEECNVFRADVVQNGDAREELLAASPAHAEGYIFVPRVVD